MYLRRKQSILLASSLIIGFLGLIFLIRPGSSSQQKTSTSPSKLDSAEPENSLENTSSNSTQSIEGVGVGISLDGPELRLKKFHRSETKGGRKIWEIVANGAVYKPATGATSVDDAIVHFYRDNGDIVDLTAKKASLTLAGGTMSAGDFSDGVTVELNKEVSVSSDSAHYDKTANTISSQDPVTVLHKAMTLKGNTLEVDLNTDTFYLKGDILTIIDPEKMQDNSNSADQTLKIGIKKKNRTKKPRIKQGSKKAGHAKK
jgi:LPS export ABC transporter protein LptC